MIRNLNARRSANGFTLIELLVVTLILSILMAVAIPLYLSSVNDAKLKTCHANMQTIANAVQAARVKGDSTGAPYPNYSFAIGQPINKDNEPDLTLVPVCPNAGTYSIAAGETAGNTTGFEVRCSLDGKFEPGVDSH